MLIDCGFLGLTKQGFDRQGGTFAYVQVVLEFLGLEHS